MEAVVFWCGLAAVTLGAWRSYANARAVVAPLVHPGVAPRENRQFGETSADRSPVADRTTPADRSTPADRTTPAQLPVRQAMRSLAAAIGWLLVAMYGLFLVASAEGGV